MRVFVTGASGHIGSALLPELLEAGHEVVGVPAVSIAPEEADAHFGFLGQLVQLDNPVSTARTRELLGWEPVHPGLIDDLNEGHYFRP